MRISKKYLKIAGMSLLLLVAAGFVTLLILKPYLDQKLDSAVERTQGRSFQIDFLNYGKIRLERCGISFNGAYMRGTTRLKYPYFEPREFEIEVEGIYVTLRNLFPLTFNFLVKGLQAKGGRLLSEDKKENPERLESVLNVEFQDSITLSYFPFKWRKQLIKHIRDFKAWLFHDKPMKKISVSGTGVFLVDEWPISVRFHSVTDNSGNVHLEANENDLRIIAEMIETKFTDSDVKLAAKNLIKTPKLLKFRKLAEEKAGELYVKHPELSYDTFRHVFWSYWLTKAFGANFAKQATDAHEIGDESNTEAESAKDRKHNMLGIEYANSGLTEDQVIDRILSDPRIIKPKQA